MRAREDGSKVYGLVCRIGGARRENSIGAQRRDSLHGTEEGTGVAPGDSVSAAVVATIQGREPRLGAARARTAAQACGRGGAADDPESRGSYEHPGAPAHDTERYARMGGFATGWEARLRFRPSRRAFPMTETELTLMAAAAIIGFRRIPNAG